MLPLSIVWRYFYKGGQWKSIPNLLSILAVSISVASLVVAMAVISGFETTLEQTVIQIAGHINLTRRGEATDALIRQEIEPLLGDDFSAMSPFVHIRGIFAEKGKVQGVVLEGVGNDDFNRVTQWSKIVAQGDLQVLAREDLPYPPLFVGRVIFESFGLKVGDIVKVVVPLSDRLDSAGVRPKLKRFEIMGVLHFGHHEFDSRYLLTDLKTAQDFGEIDQDISGMRLKFKNKESALKATNRISNELGYAYRVDHWKDFNRNLFEAVALEKMVIFFVLLVIVIAASFNIAASLYVSVVKRFHDISLLKTIGATPRFIRWIFAWQGLIIGSVGAGFGFFMGWVICLLLGELQQRYPLMLGEIYKLDQIQLEVRILDSFLIFVAAVVICFIATFAPAKRGGKLPPVEGLRYE